LFLLLVLIGSSTALDLMKKHPTDSEKQEAFDSFRGDLQVSVEKGIDDHESKMTKMGFMFLGIFVGVIAIAALLP
jgi:hypothetical protein